MGLNIKDDKRRTACLFAESQFERLELICVKHKMGFKFFHNACKDSNEYTECGILTNQSIKVNIIEYML